MVSSGSIEDRVLVRERYAAYSDSTYQRDAEAWLDCWTQDGVRAADGVEIRGRDGLRSFWDGVWQIIETMAFFSELGPITVNGDASRRSAGVLDGGGTSLHG